MPEFIKNNAGTIIVAVALAVILVAIIIKLVKNKKQGKCTCAYGCSSCAMSTLCHKSDKEKPSDPETSEIDISEIKANLDKYEND